MKSREPRVKVSVPARMRAGVDWMDVRIENMSARGLMLKAKDEVKQGSYVEIRHGSRIIIGRIVWARGVLAGLRAQDQIDIAAVVGESRRRQALLSSPDASQIERRDERTRPPSDSAEQQAERSRQYASAFQFIIMGSSIACVCVLIAGIVGQFLGSVLGTIGTTLGG
jgi:hypothetical protein